MTASEAASAPSTLAAPLDRARSTRHAESRLPDAPVDPMFRDRWSPRAFSDEPVNPSQLRTLFEAARWAPSSGNEQPWLFVYGSREEDRARLLGGLMPMNQSWAARAPVLVYLFARRTRRDGKPYPHASFDAGAAWMSFALQAHLEGLAAHAMGGIEVEKVYQVTGVDPEEYQALVGIAVGHPGEASTLPAPLAEREVPSPRRPQDEFAFEGRRTPAT